MPFFPSPWLKDCQFGVTPVGLVAAVQRTPSSPSTQTPLNKKEVRTEKTLRNKLRTRNSPLPIPLPPLDSIIWKMISPQRFRSNFRSHPHELSHWRARTTRIRNYWQLQTHLVHFFPCTQRGQRSPLQIPQLKSFPTQENEFLSVHRLSPRSSNARL